MSKSTIRNFIIAIILLLVAAGIFGLTYKMIGDEEEKLKTQLAAIKMGNDREQTGYRLEKIAEESKQDREQLDKYFLPQVGESITFLTKVEELAPQNNVALKTNSLEEGGDKKTKEKWVDAAFTFSGSREDVERFISILENLPYVSEITSVKLIKMSAVEWEASLTIRVFIMQHEA